MIRGRTMHVYSADEMVYYGNIMFEYITPMSEEEYIDFVKEAIEEHFPNLVGKRLHIKWSNNI